MKKAIVVTFSIGAEDTLERFIKAGVPRESVQVFFFQRDSTENLLNAIKKERPQMTIINGKLHHRTVSDLCEDIEKVIGRQDIDGRIYAFEAPISVPGVEFVTLEETARILLS